MSDNRPRQKPPSIEKQGEPNNPRNLAPRPEPGGIVFESFQTPIPLAKQLEDYERVMPGLARELVDAWYGETSHRRAIEIADQEDQRTLVRAEAAARARGQHYAIAIALAGLAAAVVLGLTGREVAALGAVGFPMAGIAVAVATGRRNAGPRQPPATGQAGDGNSKS